jgi:hypothetical protein
MVYYAGPQGTQFVQDDPRFQLPSGTQQVTKITGNVGLEPAVSGSVRVAGGAGSPGVTMSGGGGGGGTRPPVTGSGADAPLPSGRGGGTSSIPNPRTGVPAPNQNVPTGGFEALLNQLRTGVGANRGLLGKAARYGPGAGRTLEEFGKGNYLEALGSAGGMVAAGAGVKALAAGIPAVGLPGMLAKGGLYAAGSLLGSDIGANLAGGVGKLFGIGGQAAQDAAGAADRRTMAEGKSPTGLPGTGGKGLESLTFEQLQELIRMQGSGLLESASPIINQNRNAEMSRTMQLNQQVGQLTGALNQQKYMADLALGAQSEAGATTRTMLTAPNPYASSAFQYRG